MQRRRRPAGGLDDLQGSQVFAETIGERAIELQPVAIRAHASIAQQIARVLMAEKIFAGSHGPGIKLGQRCLESEIEWIAGLFIPEQRILAQHARVGDGGFEVEASVGIDRELGLGANFGQHGFDALAIVFEGAPPIFILTTV